MISKHFFKVLLGFLGIIILVLASFFIVYSLEQNGGTNTTSADQTPVAK